MTMTLTQDRLRELVSYDEQTGVFQWRASVPHSARKAGQVAGSQTTQGYWKLRIDGHDYLAHRLAWLYVHGEWPRWQVDHTNGNRLDNRMANLRDVDHATNQQNRRHASKGKATPLGVYWTPFNSGKSAGGTFLARVRVAGKTVTVGSFDDPDVAHRAYVEAKRRLHAGCTL